MIFLNERHAFEEAPIQTFKATSVDEGRQRATLLLA
jgi:hypothetical protein